MAEEHFYYSVNMHGLEVRNHRIHLLASDPGSPNEADLWYNTTDHVPRVRTNAGTRNILNADDDFYNRLALVTAAEDTDQMLIADAGDSFNYKRISRANFLASLPYAENAYYRFIVETGTTQLDASGSDDVVITGDGSVFQTVGSLVGNQTVSFSFISQSVNTVFAGPSSGGSGTPDFRALVDDDMPTSYNATNWDTAYTHSQTITGNPHSVILSDLGLALVQTVGDPGTASNIVSEAGIRAAIVAEDFWDRVTGTPNYLHPKNSGDYLKIDGNFRLDNNESVSHVSRGIYWGDEVDLYDTGIYEINDDQLAFAASTPVMTLYNIGLFSYGAGQWALLKEDATSTNPNIIPNYPDTGTGIGYAGTNQLSLIAGDIEGMRVEATQITLPADGIINFGDNDTAIYEVSDILYLKAGAAVSALVTSTAIRGGSGYEFQINTQQGLSSTVPIYTNRGDTNTGIGFAADDTVSIIAGGKEMINVKETGTATTDQIIVPISGNAAATPMIAFGDGDTGFYEDTDDLLYISIAGTGWWYFTSSSLRAANTAGPSLVGAGTTSNTVPSILAYRTDSNTGIGGTGNDDLSLIAGGIEAARGITTGIIINKDIIFVEQGDHSSTPAASYGYLWVKNDDPSSLIFTDDAGTDYDLTALGPGDVSWGTPSNNYIVYGDSTSKNIASGASLAWDPTNTEFSIVRATTNNLYAMLKLWDSDATGTANNYGFLYTASGRTLDSGDVIFHIYDTGGDVVKITGDGTVNIKTGAEFQINGTSVIAGMPDWGTANDNYIVIGSVGGAGEIQSSSALTFDGDLLSVTIADDTDWVETSEPNRNLLIYNTTAGALNNVGIVLNSKGGVSYNSLASISAHSPSATTNDTNLYIQARNASNNWRNYLAVLTATPETRIYNQYAYASGWSDHPTSLPNRPLYITRGVQTDQYGSKDYTALVLHSRGAVDQNSFAILAVNATSTTHASDFTLTLRAGSSAYYTVFKSNYLSYHYWQHPNASNDVRHHFVTSTTTRATMGYYGVNDGFYITTGTWGVDWDFFIGCTNHNVEIGSQSDLSTVRLSVNANIASGYAGSFLQSGDNANRYGVRIETGEDDQSSSGNDNYYVRCYAGDGTTEVGGLKNNNNTFTCYDATSDVWLKTNIHDLKVNALDIILKTPVRQYNWRTKPDADPIVGYIAQEVGLVQGMAFEKEDGYFGLVSAAIIPYLHKAVQQHYQITETYEERIKKLETKIGKLQKELNNLKQNGSNKYDSAGSDT